MHVPGGMSSLALLVALTATATLLKLGRRRRAAESDVSDDWAGMGGMRHSWLQESLQAQQGDTEYAWHKKDDGDAM